MNHFMPDGRQGILRPDHDQILEHLTMLFGEEIDGTFEIAWTRGRAIDNAKVFNMDDLERAAALAVERNSDAGSNVYIGLTSRQPGTFPDGRTTDGDYYKTLAVAVDLDDEGAFDDARLTYASLNMKPTFAVVTGVIPHTRAQLIYKLEEPFGDPDIHREMMRGLAIKFSGDRSISNPGRVMRLGGTIAWATKPGRQNEMTALHKLSGIEYPTTRLLAVAREAIAAERTIETPTSGLGLVSNVGADIDGILREIKTADGGRWRELALQMTASMVSRGLPDSAILAMAEAMTAEGWTVSQTVADLEKMIEGARQKGYAPTEPAPDLTPEEKAEIPAALFRPWTVIDPSRIPVVEFLYSDLYARGYTTLTVAPPKVGKSLVALAEAVDIASGRGFLSGVQREPQRVVYYNAEDDQNVIDARVVAICQHYRIDQQSLVGNLFAQSGVTDEDFYLIDGMEGEINERLFIAMEKFCLEQSADVLIFDPLQDVSRSPETNEVFRTLGQRLRRMAAVNGIALGLVHHTRKMTPGVTPSIDDARGGSGLRGTARFNRLLVPMTEDEGAKAGVENHRHFFRIGDMESNLAPPGSPITQWFYKASVEIPNGQSVGVATKWVWPDAFTGITADDARRVRAAVDARRAPPRYNPQANAWVGYLIAEALNLDPDDKATKSRLKTMIDRWIEEDVLRSADEHDRAKGRDVKIVICGANNLPERDV